MYELSRIRLCSVGPAGARFHDVVLDLRGAGQPIDVEQDDLFGPATHTLRPSPASILFLENGGGKTVLLKLVFSVLLPGRKQVKDAPNPRLIEDFVLAGDVSHVVLEWMHATTGDLLVSGKVMTWKDDVVSKVTKNFQEGWYYFRPNGTLNLENLPVTENGRYLALDAFRQQTQERQAEDESLEVTWPPSHTGWTDRLGLLGLDPALFHYQRVMNRDEGEAVHAFALDSDARFVEFLLEAVTEPEPLDALASLVAKHVHKLAQRRSLQCESDFVSGTLDLLEPLMDASRAVTTARAATGQATRDLTHFAGQIARRVLEDDQRVEQLRDRAGELKGELDQAELDAKRWQAAEAQQELALAGLLLKQAEAALSSAKDDVVSANRLVAAWHATPQVLHYRQKTADAQLLRDQVAAGEQRARPALEARDRHARQFALGLRALDTQARASAQTEVTAAEQHTKSATDQRHLHGQAVCRAADAAAQARTHLDRVAAAVADAERAVADHLAPGVDLLPEASLEAGKALEATAERLAGLDVEQDEIAALHETAQNALEQAVGKEAEAKNQARRAHDRLDDADTLAAALHRDPLVSELLDGEQIDLAQDTEVLRERLTEQASRADKDTITLRLEEMRDEQARLALADGKRLPPPQILTHACERLQAENIYAWTGWDYLADLPAHRREDLLARAPHLVSGVLLNDPADLDTARGVLEQLQPGATAFVSVAATAALDDPASHLAGTAFALPFHSALFDDDAARAEHLAIEERWNQRSEQLTQLTDRRRQLENLRHRLDNWRTTYPVGALALLREAAATASQAVTTAEELTADRRTQAGRLAQRRDQIVTEQRAARDTQTRQDLTCRRLAELAERLHQIPTWKEQAAAAQSLADQATLEAETADAAAADHERRAQAHLEGAAEHRRIAAAACSELTALPITEPAEVADSDTTPSEPVEVLRHTYTMAKAHFDSADVPGDRRRQLQQAEAEEADAKKTCAVLKADVYALAEALLATSAAADTESRALALQRALEGQQEAVDTVGRAHHACGLHRGATNERQRAYDAATAQDLTPMPLPTQPRDLEGHRQASALAARHKATAQTAAATARAHHNVAQRSHALAQEAAKGIALLAGTLKAVTPPEPAAEPYPGDADAAARASQHLHQAKQTAQDEQERRERNLHRATFQLTRHATAENYSQLTIPVRQQINTLDRDQLAAKAPEWTDALRTRLRNLTDEINQISRHRQAITDHLQGEISKALSTLRTAQRVSALPRTLDDWGGQEFLQLHFDRLSDELLAPKLADAIEEAATGRTSDGRPVKRDGMALLLRGIHTAVPKGFRVHILKPDTVLRTERVRVSDVKNVFSGGQQLTAAIMLYCTMAALRANHKGRKHHRHSGVLFLDNPIGRANADYLLDLQRAVARALGVQLIYTTGLFDENVLSQFPLIIRLRNDADLRAARKYLVVDDTETRSRLALLDAPDHTGNLTAVRIIDRDTP